MYHNTKNFYKKKIILNLCFSSYGFKFNRVIFGNEKKKRKNHRTIQSKF